MSANAWPFSENQSDRSRAALAQLRRLNTVLEVAQLIEFEVDLETMVRVAGEFELHRFGKRFSTIDMLLSASHPDDQQRLQAAIEQAQYDGHELSVDHRLRLPDGQWCWLRTFGKVLDKSEQHPGVLVGVSIDISETRMRNERLRQALKQAQDGSRAKAAFLSGMSHEIRTPLNAILGCADMLIDGQLDATQQQMALTLRNSARTLLDVVNNVLDFSKIESGSLDLAKEPYDALQCLESAAESVAADAAAKKLRLHIYCRKASLPWVVGDGGRVRQILSNLLSNAVKFTSSGVIEAEIDWSVTESGRGTLVFVVRDSGIGIAPSVRERLFEPFGQGDASTTRGYGGSGLGLVTCKRLIDAMDVKISVDSRVMGGSVFTVHIPANASDLEDSDSQDSVPSKLIAAIDNDTTRRWLAKQCEYWNIELVSASANSDEGLMQVVDSEAYQHLDQNQRKGICAVFANGYGARSARKRGSARVINWPFKPSDLLQALDQFESAPTSVVQFNEADPRQFAVQIPLRTLIVEDNMVNQTVLKAMLVSLGYKVDAVATGYEAIELAQERTYDLILMDLEMPGIDGLATSRALRDVFRSETHPWIVAVTAHVIAETRDKIVAAGINDYLPKPVMLAGLKTTLERAFNSVTQ